MSKHLSNQKIVDPLTMAGFIELNGSSRPRMTISTFAKTKHGKTWMALSAPGDIGVVSLDTNCRVICEKYHRLNPEKKIHYQEFLRSPLSQLAHINEVKKHWTQVRDAYFRLIESKSVATCIWDSFSQAWEDVRLAYVGREKPDMTSPVDNKGEPIGTAVSIVRTKPRDLGEPKRELREIVNAATAAGKNLVLIHRAKSLWLDEKDTGRQTMDGMPGVGYFADVEIEQFRDNDSGEFVARLLSSTVNSEIRGRAGASNFDPATQRYSWLAGDDELVGDEIVFPVIGTRVFPDSNYEDWI